MIKSGIIVGVVAFISTLIISVISPLCSVCGAIILGLIAGYLAGVFERPLTQDKALRLGAGAGALAGGLMIPGSLIAGAINASAMQDPSAQVLNQMLGVPPAESGVVWALQLGTACCIGLINIALVAGGGAGGGALWQNMNTGKRQMDDPFPPPT